VLRTRSMNAFGVGGEAEATQESPRPMHRGRPGGAVAPKALEHMDSLHHFARYLSGSAAEAENLVQDTYARALGAESTFVAGTNLRAWLFRILRGAFIDGQRRKRHEAVVGEDADAEPSCERTPFAHEPLRGDAEMGALRGAVASDIESALAALSPDARALVLLDLEGFTEGEVAEVLACAVGTVKSRLARARETLRRHLSEYRR
jgi:RNA polymerase sigma-70 factor (ECF subfamily)